MASNSEKNQIISDNNNSNEIIKHIQSNILDTLLKNDKLNSANLNFEIRRISSSTNNIKTFYKEELEWIKTNFTSGTIIYYAYGGSSIQRLLSFIERFKTESSFPMDKKLLKQYNKVEYYIKEIQPVKNNDLITKQRHIAIFFIALVFNDEATNKEYEMALLNNGFNAQLLK
ncbi:uncharacterized protein SCDLUD_000616 [Saccharomycodes ludwigii]|uniref:uncharacterized protein n=1 Tax=Saccharomycodes ludwigii TaxID=36035 RepID=UPI001E89193A|nr:hypothetical protein SCDLUD_000616 [Saccharomycodes ludwigii]KAH3903012.1 hypothetical protein SCDLUD_000616 [Saccharomycodes ludwigii]